MFENWIRLAKIYRRQFRSVGAGGSVIKELQEEFSVKINIDREPDDVSFLTLKFRPRFLTYFSTGWQQERRSHWQR